MRYLLFPFLILFLLLIGSVGFFISCFFNLVGIISACWESIKAIYE